MKKQLLTIAAVGLLMHTALQCEDFRQPKQETIQKKLKKRHRKKNLKKAKLKKTTKQWSKTKISLSIAGISVALAGATVVIVTGGPYVVAGIDLAHDLLFGGELTRKSEYQQI